MPEPVDGEQPLEERLARVARAVPGVSRLEPSLAHAIRQLSRLGGSPSPERSDSTDGITLSRREDAVDVAVEISVAGPGTALDTAVAVRDAVLGELELAALARGTVDVRVLSVDADPARHSGDIL